MRRKKSNSPAVKATMKLLDKAAKKYGLAEVRRATNRWSTGQRDRLRLAKQRVALQEQLSEVTRRLSA